MTPAGHERSFDVSVVLCTYNGGRYLEEELESVARQTLPPCELVVRDDGSTDETESIVDAYRRRAPFPVRWTRNATRLGPGANFGAAIADARGEVIALCDQDDVWQPTKLAQLATELARHPDAPFVFSDAIRVDADLQPLPESLWDVVHCTPAVRSAMRHGEAFRVLLRRNVVTGATMAFRARHRDLILPVPPSWIHDGWIALLLSVLGPPAIVDEPLVLYRQHGGNEVGARRRPLLEQVRQPRRFYGSAAHEAAGQFELVRERLATHGLPGVDAVADKVRFLRRRAELASSLLARAPEVFRLQKGGDYRRYADGVRSAVKDLLRPER